MPRPTSPAKAAETRQAAAGARFHALDRDLGIRADGHDPGVRFTAIDEALANARKLIERGYKSAEVFDRQTGQTLRTLER